MELGWMEYDVMERDMKLLVSQLERRCIFGKEKVEDVLHDIGLGEQSYTKKFQKCFSYTIREYIKMRRNTIQTYGWMNNAYIPNATPMLDNYIIEKCCGLYYKNGFGKQQIDTKNMVVIKEMSVMLSDKNFNPQHDFDNTIFWKNGYGIKIEASMVQSSYQPAWLFGENSNMGLAVSLQVSANEIVSRLHRYMCGEEINACEGNTLTLMLNNNGKEWFDYQNLITVTTGSKDNFIDYIYNKERLSIRNGALYLNLDI